MADYEQSNCDSTRVFLLIKISDEYRQHNPDSTYYYSQLAYKQALSSRNDNLIAHANVTSALAMAYRFEYGDALITAYNAIEHFRLVKNEYGQMRAYAAIGVIHGLTGAYFKGIENCYLALRLADKLGDIKIKGTTLNNIAYIHIMSGKLDKALVLLKQISLLESDSIPSIKGMALANTAIIYMAQMNFDTALYYYNMAEHIALLNDDRNILQIVYVNKAHMLLFQNKLEEAASSYREAISLQLQLSQFRALAASYKGLGDIYLKMNNFAEARNYFMKSDSVANTHDIKEARAEFYRSMYILSERTLLFEDAYRYATLYMSIKDSLVNLDVKRQIAALEAGYELELKQNAIEILEIKEVANLQKIKAQYRIIALLSFGVLIFLVLALITALQRLRISKAYKQLVAMNLEAMSREVTPSKKALRRVFPLKKDEVDNDENNRYNPTSEEILSIQTLESSHEQTQIKYQKSVLNEEQKEIILKKIHQLFEEEKVFLNPDLSINDVSEKLGVYNKYISQVINEKLHMNFANFVNNYRIVEARKMLVDENFKNYTIEGIGQTCGFNSKTSFNTAFKKFTGIIPSFFRENAMGKLK